MTNKNNARLYKMEVLSVYELYIKKIEKKNRTKSELNAVICWLTGYDEPILQSQLDSKINFEDFFAQAPKINENATLIKGIICGVRVEDIEDPLVQKIRWLDKLVDELAKGKHIDKILRKPSADQPVADR